MKKKISTWTNPCQTFPQLIELNDRYHNAYMIHNETLYCDSKEEWRGNYSCLKVRLHFTRDKGFYYTTVFAPGVFLNFLDFFPKFLDFLKIYLSKPLHSTTPHAHAPVVWTAIGFIIFAFSGLVLVMSSFFTFWIEYDATPARWKWNLDFIIHTFQILIGSMFVPLLVYIKKPPIEYN